MQKIFVVGIGLASLSLAFIFQNCAPKFEAASLDSLVVKNTLTTELSEISSTNCEFQDQLLIEGQTKTMYFQESVAFGSTCASEVRTCQNGIMTGSYTSNHCSINAAVDCMFGGAVLPNGETKKSFKASAPGAGQSCSAIQSTVRCENGVLVGPNYRFSSCTENAPADCLFSEKIIPHGDSILGYSSPTVSGGMLCVSSSLKCFDGKIQNAESYPYSSCQPAEAKSCTFGGTQYLHGNSVIGFSTSSVASGASCLAKSIRKTCSNGVWSDPTFIYSNCSENRPADCLHDGIQVNHGDTLTGFKLKEVIAPNTCVSQTLTCNNGVMANQTTYPNKSCKVSPLTPDIYSTLQVAEFGTVPLGSAREINATLKLDHVFVGSEFVRFRAEIDGIDAKDFVVLPENQDQLIYTLLHNGIGLPLFVRYQPKIVKASKARFSLYQDNVLVSQYVLSGQAVAYNLGNNCAADGLILASGSTIKLFKDKTVVDGTCVYEDVTCTNGTLSGTARNGTCSLCAYNTNPLPNRPSQRKCAQIKYDVNTASPNLQVLINLIFPNIDEAWNILKKL